MLQGNPDIDILADMSTIDLEKDYDYAKNLNNIEFCNERNKMHKIDMFAMKMNLNSIEDKALVYEIQPEEIEWAKTVCGRGTYIGIVLRSTCDVKNLPLPRLKKLCDMFLELGYKLVVFDEKSCSMFNEEGIINACGKYGIRQCAALIKRCKVILTPDTGFMHLAAALNKKVVCYFGAMRSDWLQTHKKLYSIHKDVPCFPCNAFSCAMGRNICIQNLTNGELVEAVSGAVNDHN